MMNILLVPVRYHSRKGKKMGILRTKCPPPKWKVAPLSRVIMLGTVPSQYTKFPPGLYRATNGFSTKL
jgi:hypothetical protein